jgi:hypothetical protein
MKKLVSKFANTKLSIQDRLYAYRLYINKNEDKKELDTLFDALTNLTRKYLASRYDPVIYKASQEARRIVPKDTIHTKIVLQLVPGEVSVIPIALSNSKDVAVLPFSRESYNFNTDPLGILSICPDTFEDKILRDKFISLAQTYVKVKEKIYQYSTKYGQSYRDFLGYKATYKVLFEFDEEIFEEVVKKSGKSLEKVYLNENNPELDQSEVQEALDSLKNLKEYLK